MPISPKYQQCAVEAGTCPISAPTSVGYVAIDGKDDIYYRTTASDLVCHAPSFTFPGDKSQYPGDPAPLHPKVCKSMLVPSDIANPSSTFFDANGNPASAGGWASCAAEGATCNPSGTDNVDILYGANGKFNYVNASSLPCDVKHFGDPIPGTTKSCFWRNPVPQVAPLKPITKLPNHKLRNILIIIGILLLLIIIIIVIVLLTRKH